MERPDEWHEFCPEPRQIVVQRSEKNGNVQTTHNISRNENSTKTKVYTNKRVSKTSTSKSNTKTDARRLASIQDSVYTKNRPSVPKLIRGKRQENNSAASVYEQTPDCTITIYDTDDELEDSPLNIPPLIIFKNKDGEYKTNTRNEENDHVFTSSITNDTALIQNQSMIDNSSFHKLPSHDILDISSDGNNIEKKNLYEPNQNINMTGNTFSQDHLFPPCQSISQNQDNVLNINNTNHVNITKETMKILPNIVGTPENNFIQENQKECIKILSNIVINSEGSKELLKIDNSAHGTKDMNLFYQDSINNHMNSKDLVLREETHNYNQFSVYNDTRSIDVDNIELVTNDKIALKNEEYANDTKIVSQENTDSYIDYNEGSVNDIDKNSSEIKNCDEKIKTDYFGTNLTLIDEMIKQDTTLFEMENICNDVFKENFQGNEECIQFYEKCWQDICEKECKDKIDNSNKIKKLKKKRKCRKTANVTVNSKNVSGKCFKNISRVIRKIRNADVSTLYKSCLIDSSNVSKIIIEITPRTTKEIGIFERQKRETRIQSKQYKDASTEIPVFADFQENEIMKNFKDTSTEISSFSNFQDNEIVKKFNDASTEILSFSDLQEKEVIKKFKDASTEIPSVSDFQENKLIKKFKDASTEISSLSDFGKNKVLKEFKDAFTEMPSFSDFQEYEVINKFKDASKEMSSFSNFQEKEFIKKFKDTSAKLPSTSNYQDNEMPSLSDFQVNEIELGLPLFSDFQDNEYLINTQKQLLQKQELLIDKHVSLVNHFEGLIKYMHQDKHLSQKNVSDEKQNDLKDETSISKQMETTNKVILSETTNTNNEEIMDRSDLKYKLRPRNKCKKQEPFSLNDTQNNTFTDNEMEESDYVPSSIKKRKKGKRSSAHRKRTNKIIKSTSMNDSIDVSLKNMQIKESGVACSTPTKKQKNKRKTNKNKITKERALGTEVFLVREDPQEIQRRPELRLRKPKNQRSSKEQDRSYK